MKESIPNGAFIGIIVAVVIVLGFLGFKFMGPHRESGSSAQDMQKRIAEHGGGYSKSGTPSTGTAWEGPGRMAARVAPVGIRVPAGIPPAVAAEECWRHVAKIRNPRTAGGMSRRR